MGEVLSEDDQEADIEQREHTSVDKALPERKTSNVGKRAEIQIRSKSFELRKADL